MKVCRDSYIILPAGVEAAQRSSGGGGLRTQVCFQKAVIMSFTPCVWLGCSRLTHWVRLFSLRVVRGLSVPADGRRIWPCGFLLWSSWYREARHVMVAIPLSSSSAVANVVTVFSVYGAQWWFFCSQFTLAC